MIFLRRFERTGSDFRGDPIPVSIPTVVRREWKGSKSSFLNKELGPSEKRSRFPRAKNPENHRGISGGNRNPEFFDLPQTDVVFSRDSFC
uniref:Uncharacterized protein n=1 Tax=Leptospira ellisii TaxID=2023197 RepID=A0A2N0B515_9LEPT|nr:hypothetical protein CH379_17470 [Leptospira ellisii]